MWALSDAQITPLFGQARPMPDMVDYRFVNGWVDTGDLPCRDALRAMLPSRTIRLDDCPALPHIHAGGEDPRVDFSTFRFTPDLIARWARCAIGSPLAQTVTFEAETCGGLTLWAGSDKTLTFEPYTRNEPRKTCVSIDLAAGETVLTVRFDDLHERDTSCFFRLTLIDGQRLTSHSLGAGDPVELENARGVLAGTRTHRIFYEQGPIELVTDQEPSAPVTLRLAGPSEGSVTLKHAKDPVAVPTGADLLPGCPLLDLTAQVGGATLSKTIGTTYLPNGVPIDQPDLAGRKAAARALMTVTGQATPARALILLSAGQRAQAETLLAPAMTAITQRHDCADFFLLPILRIWRDHGVSDGLSPDMTVAIRDAILGFRYWLDEPGNDVMWFWSENHVLCFHVAQYIAGGLFPEQVFANSDKTGAEQAQLGHARLLRWFNAVERHGLAEWNSAAYYPIDFLALLTLVDMSPDPAIAARAAALCDAIFAMVALHTIGGVPAGCQGRAYEKELFAGPATELGALTAIAFGGRWYAGHDRAAALFAMSDYAPPAALAAYEKVPAGSGLVARYVQGLDANAHLCLWKSTEAQLSSVTDHRTGTIGHQQHVVDLQLATHPLARIWINHPGDLKPWGGSRPSLWAGNGIMPRAAQHNNRAMLIYDLDRHAHPIGFTHVFVPQEIMDEVLHDGPWIFARRGTGYAALWCSTVPARHEGGLYAGSEWRAMARQTAWLVVAGGHSIHGPFETFRADCTRLAPDFDPAALRLTAQAMELAHDGPLTVDGQPRPFAPLSFHPHVGLNDDPLSPLDLTASR